MFLTPSTLLRRISRAGLLPVLGGYSAALTLAVAVQYPYDAVSMIAAWGGLLLLLAWTGFLLWAPVRQALIRGVIGGSAGLGLALGLLWTVEIGINNLLAPPLPGRDIVDDLFWAAIAVGILALACTEAYRAQRVRAGIAAGLWSGLASGTVACATALSVIVFGMALLLRDPLNVAEWAARGQGEAPSMAAYFAFQTLAGALLHLTVLGGLMGLLLGGAGGVLGKGASLASRLPRRTR